MIAPTLVLALSPIQCTAQEVQELVPPQPGSYEHFGSALALQGSTAVIGAEGSFGQTVQGRVHVFYRSVGETWTQVKELSGDASDGDEFGRAVALDGDTLGVGAPHEVDGTIYVYERDLGGPDSWGLSQKIDPGSFYGFDFGASVAIEGDILLAGVPIYGDPSEGTQPGGVWVYRRQAGRWSLHQELSGSGTESGNRFGAAVAIDGGRLLVGAPSTGLAPKRGAFVFEYDSGSDTWLETAVLQPPGAFPLLLEPGGRVALEGNRAMLSDRFYGNNGAAWVYDYDQNTGSWNEEARLTHSNPLPEDEFGSSIALAGDIAMVGSAGHETVSTFYREQGGPGSWDELPGTMITSSGPARYFGESLALDGHVGIVGAPRQKQGSFVQAGVAIVFEGAGVAPPSTYCTAKVNSAGCTPTIGWSGTSPSVSAATGFLVTSSNTLDQKSGLFFYGYAPKASSYQGGWLCVQAPVKRTALQNSGGTPPCGGLFSYDFNAHIASGVDPALVPGITVHGQYWSRDPQSSFNTNRSDAIRLTICP